MEAETRVDESIQGRTGDRGLLLLVASRLDVTSEIGCSVVLFAAVWSQARVTLLRMVIGLMQ